MDNYHTFENNFNTDPKNQNFLYSKISGEISKYKLYCSVIFTLIVVVCIFTIMFIEISEIEQLYNNQKYENCTLTNIVEKPNEKGWCKKYVDDARLLNNDACAEFPNKIGDKFKCYISEFVDLGNNVIYFAEMKKFEKPAAILLYLVRYGFPSLLAIIFVGCGLFRAFGY